VLPRHLARPPWYCAGASAIFVCIMSVNPAWRPGFIPQPVENGAAVSEADVRERGPGSLDRVDGAFKGGCNRLAGDRSGLPCDSFSALGCSTPARLPRKRSAASATAAAKPACLSCAPDHPLCRSGPRWVDRSFSYGKRPGWHGHRIVIIRRPGLAPRNQSLAVQADAEKVDRRCSRHVTTSPLPPATSAGRGPASHGSGGVCR